MTLQVCANNGTAPASALATLPGANGDGSPHTAPHVTVAAYGRIRGAMQAAGLGDLMPTDGWSCYRDRAAQQHMRDIGLTTIPVGQSIHGEWTYGSAVDFSDLGGFGAPRHEWLRANGGPYGWYQPGWATAGGSLPESWHWEYDERGDAHYGEPSGSGFLMALTDDQQLTLYNAVLNLQGWVWKGGPDVDNPTPSVPWPTTIAGRVRNLDLQTLGSEGFSPSVAERVINIEAVTDEVDVYLDALTRVGGGHGHGHGHGRRKRYKLSRDDIERIAARVAEILGDRITDEDG